MALKDLVKRLDGEWVGQWVGGWENGWGSGWVSECSEMELPKPMYYVHVVTLFLSFSWSWWPCSQYGRLFTVCLSMAMNNLLMRVCSSLSSVSSDCGTDILEREREGRREGGRETDTWTDRHTEQTDIPTDRYTDTWTDRHTDTWTDRQTHERTDIQTHEQTDRHMNRQTHEQTTSVLVFPPAVSEGTRSYQLRSFWVCLWAAWWGHMIQDPYHQLQWVH